MNPTFTIIWVEDKPRTVGSQIGAIREYLKSRNFEPNIILDEDGKQFQKAIKNKILIDIVVTDKNLTESMDGIAVIKELKQKKRLTDVLFYSAKGFDPEEVRQEHYGFVEIVEGKDIEDQLKKLINKNLNRCEDIVFLRGMVISMIIDLELKVNEFFVGYFKIPKANQEHFHNYILENQYNSLGGKVVTLENIIKKQGLIGDFKKMLQDIRELANKRNLLAHCKTDPQNKNVLICMGEQKTFDKGEINKLLDKINDTSEILDNLINKF
jgi:response regulator RpfG family c-di-GMP phosphodiesterase